MAAAAAKVRGEGAVREGKGKGEVEGRGEGEGLQDGLTRRKKTSRERREQRVRAEGRNVCALLRAFAAVHGHRGGEVSRLGTALWTVLSAPVPEAAPPLQAHLVVKGVELDKEVAKEAVQEDVPATAEATVKSGKGGKEKRNNNEKEEET